MATTGDHTAAVLEILIKAGDAKGSSYVHDQLLRRGFRVSEPTVGRFLRTLDRRGFTKKQGHLGRAVTAKGRSHFERLQLGASRDHKAQQLVRTIRAETLADLVNVLVARRGIERELARAAALNATPSDIAELRKQDELLLRGESTAGLHALLARAAHNPLLESVYHLITRDPEITRLVDRLMAARGKFIDPEFDRQLIDALVARDPDAAEAVTVAHLNDVIATVEEYWAAVANA